MTSRKFNKLNLLDIPVGVTNTEAMIFKYRDKGNIRIFKNLFRLKGSTFANKLYTLEMLDNNKELLPANYVLPDYLVSVDGKINGFSMPYIAGTNLSIILNDMKIDAKDKIKLLKKVGELLESLDSIRNTTQLKNLFINDLHESNFIVTPENELKIIDLDSSKICDNKPFPSKYLMPNSLTKYTPDKYTVYNTDLVENKSDDYDSYKQELGYLETDKNTDLYCYTIMILNYLYGGNVNHFSIDEFYTYMCYLEDIGIDESLINVFKKMLSSCDNESPLPYLDHLTDEQIGRSNHIVYNIAKKKINLKQK